MRFDLRRVPLLVAVLAATAVSTPAQQSNRFHGWLRHVEGDQLGENAPFTALGGTGRFLSERGVWLLNGEALVSNDGDPGGSLGFGGRFWVRPDTIVGAGISYEANRSPFENLFRQSIVSVDAYHRTWSARANLYVPLGDRVQRGLGPTLAGPGQVVFTGSSIVTAGAIEQIDETSMRGFDAELGHEVGGPRGEVFVGYYRLEGEIGEDTDGAKGGIRYHLTPRVSARLTVSDDPLFETNVYGGLTWTFGGEGRLPDTLESKLTFPFERNTQVAVNPVDNSVSDQTVLTDGGAPITVAHIVSGGAGGTGTVEDPYRTLTAATGNASDVVYVGAGSVFNGEDYRLAPGQQLVGEGGGMVQRIMTDQLGLVDLPVLAGSGLPRPAINGAPGAAITLAAGSRVSNFDIFGAGAGIQADNLQGVATVEDVTISGGFAGIDVIGGIGSMTFTNVDIDGPVGTSFNVNGGSANITFAGSIAHDSAGDAVAITNHTGGTIRFASGAIVAGDGAGLQFNNAGGSYFFDGAVDLNGGDAGIDIQSSSGTFSFADASIVDPTGDAFHLNGGNASVTFTGDISQSGSGAAVSVTNHGAGTLTFGGGTIAATGGSGLQFNNADGTYAFDSAVSLNGGDAGIDILGSSNGIFSFADASVVDPTGTALTVNGGGASVTYSGNLTKSNSGALVSVTNHANGSLIFSDGVISATAGNGLQFNNADGTYSFGSDVVLNGGDAGIDILGGSGGSFTFSNGMIVNPTGMAINVSGGTSSLVYNGNITKSGLGSTISITNHSGGSFTFGNGTISATSGTGLFFNNASGTYTFNSAITLNGGDAGIDILGGSNGTFLFADAAITNPTGTAFNVENLGPDGAIDYYGSIINDNDDLVTIRTTVAGSSIRFHDTGSSSLTADGGGGILVQNADGSVAFDAPITIVDPTESFALAGIRVAGGGGTVTFRDTTVQVLNSLAGIGAAVEIDSQNGTVAFTDLAITTTSPGTVGLAATASNRLELFGTNTLDVTGGIGIAFDDVANVDIDIASISVENSDGAGVSLLGLGNGTVLIADLSVDGAVGDGVELDNGSASVTFTNVDITDVGGAGISVGAGIGNPGAVVVSGGTIDDTTGDGVRLRDAASFTLNGVTFTSIGGATIDLADSTVGGSGNDAAGFTCVNGGGNSGSIEFNDGMTACP